MNQFYFFQPDSFSARFFQVVNGVVVEGNGTELFPMPVFHHKIDDLHKQDFEDTHRPNFISDVNDYKVNISSEQAIQILLNYLKDNNIKNHGGEFNMQLDKSIDTLNYNFKMNNLPSSFLVNAATGEVTTPTLEDLTTSDM